MWQVAGSAVATLLVVALAALLREVIRLRERVSWLEAKVNGKDRR